jgi:hypothetical protein
MDENLNSTPTPSPEIILPVNSSILICGAARNVEKRLSEFIEKSTYAFSNFKHIEFAICESFSTDGTVRALLDLEVECNNITFIKDSNVIDLKSKRTVKIASAREQLRLYALKRSQDFDYVAMMDLDGVNRGLTPRAVVSCWNHAGWDVATANQSFRYYDIWALRADNWSEDDCWLEYRTLLNSHTQRRAKRIAVTKKMKSISANSKPIEVKSAFGGLAIYKIEAFVAGKYSGVNEKGEEICEHVPFHEHLRKQGYKIFLIPSLINLNRRNQVLIQLKGFIVYIQLHLLRMKSKNDEIL